MMPAVAGCVPQLHKRITRWPSSRRRLCGSARRDRSLDAKRGTPGTGGVDVEARVIARNLDQIAEQPDGLPRAQCRGMVTRNFVTLVTLLGSAGGCVAEIDGGGDGALDESSDSSDLDAVIARHGNDHRLPNHVPVSDPTGVFTTVSTNGV